MQTYVRPPIVFTHGEGARLYDAFGKEYLDFAAGIAVNALGANTSLADTYMHIGVLYRIKPAAEQVNRHRGDNQYLTNVPELCKIVLHCKKVSLQKHNIEKLSRSNITQTALLQGMGTPDGWRQ